MILFAASLCLGAELMAGQFPIGLYNATTPQDYPVIAEAGFTLVDIRDSGPGRQDQLAEAAAANGLHVMADPREVLARPQAPASWPVAAWHLFDEPEVNRDSTAAIAGLSSKVAAWDSSAPTLIVIGEGKAAALFSPWADVIALDWYPVPHLPLESLGRQLDEAVGGAGGKPVWAILQAMDWRDYPQRDPRKPRIGRFPELWELRHMTLLALAQGARGLLFYTYTKPDKRTLRGFPDQWAVLTSVVREVRRLKPFLDSGPGVPLVPGPRRRGRRWSLGRRTLTIVVDADAPRKPLVIESP